MSVLNTEINELNLAIQSADVEKVTSLVRSGHDIEIAEPKYERTSLLIAASQFGICTDISEKERIQVP